MRLIGNKTRLLDQIEDLLRQNGITGGTLIDIFSGTSSVGRHFKRRGFRVLANDLLSAAYTQAVAGVEVSRHPGFTALREAHRAVIRSREFQGTLPPPLAGRAATAQSRGQDEDPTRPLREAIHLLDRFIPPEEGLIFRSFCPGGRAGRMYFQDRNGLKIDGCLRFLRESHRSGLLEHGELHLLVAALIDGADRVANISGTYGAYLKSWQTNARSALRLDPPQVGTSRFRNRAFQEDSNRLIRRLRGDVLYIDPPYNTRQYAANYHLLDIIAEHHRVPDLDGYEAALYGKTGLRPYDDLRSAYCVPPGARRRGRAGGDVLTAMRDLILSSRAAAVVVSYNEEGLLSREQIGEVLAEFSGARSFDPALGLREVDYRRFRSDSDRPAGARGGRRRYRVVEGREPGRLSELLFFAFRSGPRSMLAPRAVGGGR